MAFYPKGVAYTRLFKLIASSDHLSLLTGASPTVNLSKAGAAFGAAGGSVAEVANGWYKVSLNTTDTNTAGDLAFYITAASADDTDFCDQVYDPAVANLGVNLVNWKGTAVASPATAGIPDVNTKNWDNVAVGAVPPDAIFLRSGTAQAGGASTITLDAGASAVNNFYDAATIFIRSGTGAGQTNTIVSYVGSTKVATVGVAWATVPDATSVFTIAAFGPVTATVSGLVTANVTQWNGTPVASPATAGIPDINVKNWGNGAVAGAIPPDVIFLHSGTAQAGGASSITLDAGAAAVNSFYNTATIFIRGGTGAGQTNSITNYVGSTKVATVGVAWGTVPDNTSVFTIAAFGPVQATVSGTVNANVIQWNSAGVAVPNVAGVPLIDLEYWDGAAIAEPSTDGVPDVNVLNWKNGAVPTVNQTGVPLVDLKYTLGTLSPATAGAVRADAVTGAVGSVTGAVGSVVANVAVTSNIKANQALAKFQFLMRDSTNHNPATGKTVTCTRSIDGGAFAAGALANVAEVSSAVGTYTVDFGAGDLNGKVIVLRATAAACDDCFERILTVP